MKLFSILVSTALAQDYFEDNFGVSRTEIFGDEGSDLRLLAEEYEGTDIEGLSRSLGADFGDDGAPGMGRASIPEGMNIFDYYVNGVFDITAFREGLLAAYTAEAAEQAVEEPIIEEAVVEEQTSEERYFFTVAATTPETPEPITPAPVTGNQCWKCDQMTYAACATEGVFEECTLGDKDCCFVEIRTKYMEVQQLCTGCKSESACKNNQAQNFATTLVNTIDPLRDQCRPNLNLQAKAFRYGAQQSVCRQCFKTCDPVVEDVASCFGGITNIAADILGSAAEKLHVEGTFTIPFTTKVDEYSGAARGSKADVLVLGIPSNLLMDEGLDGTAKIAIITSFTLGTENLYFNDLSQVKTTHGKSYDGVSFDSNRNGLDQLYWGLEGANKNWWMSDLKAKQAIYAALSTATGEIDLTTV